MTNQKGQSDEKRFQDLKADDLHNVNDLVSLNEQELAQDGLEIEDEESLAQVRGAAGLNIVRVVASIPNRVRTPDLNLTPVQVSRPQLPVNPAPYVHHNPPSPPSSGNDLAGMEDVHSPSGGLDRYVSSNVWFGQ